MAKLGSPITQKFPIGTAELRVGPLSAAGRLTQAHSVGLVDEASVEVTQETTELLGGFPQLQVASAIISQATKVTATAREASRRNFKMMLGEGVGGTAPTDFESLVVTAVALDGTGFDVTAADGSNFTVGDIVVIYPDGRPEDVVVDRVTAVAIDTITVENGFAVALDGTAETVRIFIAHQVAMGAVASTQYFAATLLQTENSTGRPIGFNMWKGSSGGSFNYATNATDFGSFDIELNVLQPSESDYTTGNLAHQASVIPSNPLGMFFGGGDA